MAGDPANVHVWTKGDLYVLDPDQDFVAATHIPADVDTPLHADWLPAGLMLGDPGFELSRDIDETDLNAWQLKRFRTVWKNGKVDGTCTLFEDNEVIEDMLDPEGVPAQKARYLAMELEDEDFGIKERRFTTAEANVFFENDSAGEEPKGRPLRMRFYPDSTAKVFKILKSVVTP